MKKVFGLFLSLIVLMGLWSCNQKELDDLQSQIDELKSVQIASINAQIAGIKSSIESMEKMDEQMKTRIDELTKKQQELESTDTEQAKEIAALKESLIEKEASLSKRIDELKSYVEKELKNQKDWVNATFCTLAQYHSTCDEIAALKLTISAQEATLRALISTTESSIKTWVNEHLTEYYTIAEMDAKIAQLSKSIADGDAAQAAELENLRAELNAARTDIKTAYEKAIEDAITTSEGKINEKIANDIKNATDALHGQIDELNTKIADIEKRLGLVEASLEKILSQVQSIVVVPTYSDGSVGIKESEDTEIRFEVSPRSASVALAKQGPEVFSLDAVSTQTKASMFVANFPIKSVSDNGECLVVKLDAAKMDMEPVYANPTMSARLKIDDGNSSMTTGYFAIISDKKYSTTPLDKVRQKEGTIGENCRIKVEVVSNSSLGNLSPNLLYVQDHSAGIAISCESNHGYQFGDVLTVDISNATIKSDEWYFLIADLPVERMVKIGHREEIKAKEVTLPEFLKGEYESQYVALADMQVVEPDLNKTWVVGNAQTRIGFENRMGYEIVVSSLNTASYGSEKVPQGSGVIRGVSTRNGELLIAQESDWNEMTGERFVCEERRYNISFESVGTKTALSESGTTWKAGDKVFLSDGKSSTVCSIPDEFDGKTMATISTKLSFVGKVTCIYPGDCVTKEGTDFYVDVPERQGEDGSVCAVFSGSSLSKDIQLSAQTALVKVSFELELAEVESVKLTFEGANAAGRMKIGQTGTEVVSGTQSVEVTATGAKEYFFSVLPGTASKMDVDVSKADGICGRRSLTPSSTFEAGRVYNLRIDPTTIVPTQEFKGLTFVSTGESTVRLRKYNNPDPITLEYSRNGFTWTPYTIGNSISLSDGEKLMFRAGKDGNASFSSGYSTGYYNFKILGSVAARGNIMSLLDRSCTRISVPLHAFNSLFTGCQSLTSAPELPATGLAYSCYASMFSGCTSLTKAPALPATVLAESCCWGMFSGCTNLTEPPVLPATELARECYYGMFSGCTSLTEAPELPATKLAPYCYYGMFEGCTSLTKAPELPATNLAPYCYYGMFEGCMSLTKASVLPATELASNCYNDMFHGCTSLTKATALPATNLAYSCYASMFSGCKSLTESPVLLATDLVEKCYSSMFSGCTSLTKAPELPATELAFDCYSGMFSGCTSLTKAPMLPAMVLAAGCYSYMFSGCTSLTKAPELPATKLASNCYSSMFNGCTNLTEAPELPATELVEACYNGMFEGCTNLTKGPELLLTKLASRCYYGMFSGCTSLTEAPELPATNLAPYCYYGMFEGCTSLNYVKALFTDEPSNRTTGDWLWGVSSAGTFVKSKDATWDVRGDDGIPDGWTVVTE